ncbi:MAG TPA: DNA primase [Oscillospiraceae bacterium]|nr:DNA primase [Oscillospiraceae bacterium]
MAFSDDFLNQLKLGNDIESTFSSYTSLKRRGRTSVCLCPFHSEKSPSCTVYPESQSFYCFGCGAGGDVISFMMRIENLEYIEAIKMLAEKAGLTVPDDRVDDKAARQKARILEVNREAARYFHSLLLDSTGGKALDYLHKRGLENKTITRFGLGYAAPEWQGIRNHLKRLGFYDNELAAAGIITKGRSNSYFDMFRDKVMFPIIDLRGNVIAFGGRLLDGNGPKYINSPETPVFNKRRNLFSLNFAKNSKSRVLMLAEGYMDVISIYQAGFPNVVATLGTAITKEQARLISQYADEVVITYDSDSAGQTATHKAINLLSEVGVRTRIINLQGAKDPDEYIKTYGAARFKLLIDGASNAIDFELGKAKAEYDVETESGKVDYLKKAIGILAQLQSPLERDVYASKICTELEVDKKTVLLEAENLIKRKHKAQERKELLSTIRPSPQIGGNNRQSKPQSPKLIKAEEGIIAYLMRNPDKLDTITAKIQNEDFFTEFYRKVFETVVSRLKNNKDINVTLLSSEFTLEEMGKISGMIAHSNEMSNDPQQLDDYINVLQDNKIAETLKSKENIKEMSADELLQLTQQIKNKKKLN